MASTLRICLIALVVIAVAVNAADLKCYQCDTVDECKGALTEQKTPVCASGEVCLRIQKGKTDDVLKRGCGTECDDYKNCKTCKEELCNSSPTLLPSFLVVGVVSTVMARYYL